MPRLALCLVAVLAAGCGNSLVSHSSRPTPPYSLDDVRKEFAAQGFTPALVFDGATATDSEVARVSRSSAGQGSIQDTALTFEQLREAGLGLIDFRSGTGPGLITVVVARDESDAMTVAAVFHRALVQVLGDNAKALDLSKQQAQAAAATVRVNRSANLLMISNGNIKPGFAARARAAIRGL